MSLRNVLALMRLNATPFHSDQYLVNQRWAWSHAIRVHKRRCLKILVFIIPICSCGPLSGQQSEVTVGAQAWSYDRVYPLLDGLFQDAASTQLLALTLNPNTSNSTHVDALVQSLQIQAGYNQLSNVQNSVAAQMAVANLGLQSTLAQQQQSILQQQIAAQQQLTQANQALALANQTGTTAQITAATQAVAAAQTTVNGLASEAALIKAPSSPYAPSGAGGNIANPTSAFTSSVPSSVSGAAIPSNGPSFPATKQLDNQMDLLWSRLARVVGTMARPDSMQSDDRLYLLEFDTATFPNKTRKNRILNTGYSLKCSDSGSTIDEYPTIVDMFPRVAAVNVTDTKYRDSSFSLGAVLAFLGFGLNAAYNREHLQLSQTLGQSSYITGYGVGQSDFGWQFGIPLGEDIISSDIKRTFVLVRVPSKCAMPAVSLAATEWMKLKQSATDALQIAKYTVNHPPTQPTTLSVVSKTMSTSAPVSPDQTMRSLSFNRIAYDPTKYSASNPAQVTLQVMLNQPLDQQATVYANGTLLRRARDTFGRAIPSGSGSSGLLEEDTSSSQVNTWIPVSSRSLIINLDGGQFGVQFPTIQIVSPGVEKPFSISSSKPTGVDVAVSGQKFECAKAPCQLPSIAYPLPALSQVGVTRWVRDASKPNAYSAVFTVVQPTTTASPSPAPTETSVQLVTGSSKNLWGANAEVYVQFPDNDVDRQQYKLTCDPSTSLISSGERLVCDLDLSEVSKTKTNLNAMLKMSFHIIDPGHVGGPLEAWPALQSCTGNACLSPIAWDISNPLWDDSQSAWTVQVQFVNAAEGAVATITPAPPTLPKPLKCSSSGICATNLIIKPGDLSSWFDHMTLQLAGYPNDQWQILNVKTLISPTVSVMSTDFTAWTGTNLTSIFSTKNDATGNTGLLVGTALIPLDCPILSACAVIDKTKFPQTASLMYLKSGTIQVPLLQLNADGTTTPIMYQPPKAPAGSANALTAAANALTAGAPALPAPPPAPPTATPAQPSQTTPLLGATGSMLMNQSIDALPNRQTILQGGPKQ